MAESGGSKGREREARDEEVRKSEEN